MSAKGIRKYVRPPLLVYAICGGVWFWLIFQMAVYGYGS